MYLSYAKIQVFYGREGGGKQDGVQDEQLGSFLIYFKENS